MRAFSVTTAMRLTPFALVFLCFLTSASAESSWTEASAEQGRLAGLSSSWSPADGEQARWWWRPESGGSAWVGWHGFQLGPLTAVAGREGTRPWGPAVFASSGWWGAAWDSVFGGGWAVQKPETFEAGAQLKVPLGWLTLAGGGDRTWELEAPVWTDRARAGVSFAAAGWSGGAEGRWEHRPRGSSRAVEGRFGWAGEGWEAEVRSAGGSGPWTARGRVGVSRGVDSASVVWDRQEGLETAAHVGLETPVFAAGPLGSARYRDEWDGDAGLWASGKWDEGRWSAEWRTRWGEPVPSHTVEAAWKRPGWEAEMSWRVEGARLGWMGPGSEVRLVWRWLY